MKTNGFLFPAFSGFDVYLLMTWLTLEEVSLILKCSRVHIALNFFSPPYILFLTVKTFTKPGKKL
jgi:hypothetical protein